MAAYAPHAPYATRKDLEDRLSAQIVRRLLDDNRDATPDYDPVSAVLRDASSKVDGYLALAPGSLLPIDMLAIPSELTRLTLDVAHAMLAKRHPEVMRVDWEKLMKAVEAELKLIRTGEVSIISPSPDLGGPRVDFCTPRYGGCGGRYDGDDFYRNDD